MAKRSFREPTMGLLVLPASMWAVPVQGASLPPHDPITVLEVSDEVNPNNLTDAELTQPGDISAALERDGSGLALASEPIVTNSQCIDDALIVLEGSAPPDVVLYFAHRPALACSGESRESDLVAAFQAHLARGGGIVVFHHGAYEWAGKEAMLALLGVSATGIQWNVAQGQRVINVAPGHFVTENGVAYDGRESFELLPLAPDGEFSYFDNVPDERYPSYVLLIEPGESRTLLFASNSGGVRALGYALERPAWQGRVVAYQPGEYQPNALDALDGPNFQILANSILYSMRAESHDNQGSGGAQSGGAGGASAGGTSSQGSGASTSVVAGGGAPSVGGALAEVGGGLNNSSGGRPSGGSTETGGTAVNEGSSSGGTSGGGTGNGTGAGCSLTRHSHDSFGWIAWGLGLLVIGQRRRLLSAQRGRL